MAIKLEGKKIAAQLKEDLTEEIIALNRINIEPTMCAIQVGDDHASNVYLNMKRRFAKDIGMNELFVKLSDKTSQEELINKINNLNGDDNINGIMVQLPLPEQINEKIIAETIAPEKDVDGLNPFNQGQLWQDNSNVVPATVRGIMKLLSHYEIRIQGKNALVIGRSLIVGKPVANQLLKENATVTIAHSRTTNLKEFTKRADIIISDVGQAHLITADMIKDNCTIIDVGMNHENGKLLGDVDYDECAEKAYAITPVPGGVGPLTVACLMYQNIILTKVQNKLIK